MSLRVYFKYEEIAILRCSGVNHTASQLRRKY